MSRSVKSSISLFLRFCLAALAVLGAVTSNAQVMSLTAFSVVSDSVNQVVNFTLTFNRMPDFNTYDGQGRQADGFWIDILNNPGPQPQLNGFGGEDLRILSTTAPTGGTPVDGFFSLTTPRDQGTQVTGTFPYQLNGSTVTFSTTFTQLHETDGYFEAILLTDRYGAAQIPGTHIAGPVPEPRTWLMLALGLVGFATRRVVRCA
jgi:hypothetical protein